MHRNPPCRYSLQANLSPPTTTVQYCHTKTSAIACTHSPIPPTIPSQGLRTARPPPHPKGPPNYLSVVPRSDPRQFRSSISRLQRLGEAQRAKMRLLERSDDLLGPDLNLIGRAAQAIVNQHNVNSQSLTQPVAGCIRHRPHLPDQVSQHTPQPSIAPTRQPHLPERADMVNMRGPVAPISTAVAPNISAPMDVDPKRGVKRAHDRDASQTEPRREEPEERACKRPKGCRNATNPDIRHFNRDSSASVTGRIMPLLIEDVVSEHSFDTDIDSEQDIRVDADGRPQFTDCAEVEALQEWVGKVWRMRTDSARTRQRLCKVVCRRRIRGFGLPGDKILVHMWLDDQSYTEAVKRKLLNSGWHECVSISPVNPLHPPDVALRRAGLDLLRYPMKSSTSLLKGRPLKAIITRKSTRENDAYSPPTTVSAQSPAKLAIVSALPDSQQEQLTPPDTVPIPISTTTAIRREIPPMTPVHEPPTPSPTVRCVSSTQPHSLLPTDSLSSPPLYLPSLCCPQEAFSGPVMMDAEPTPSSAYGPSFSSVTGPGFLDLLALAVFTSSQALDPLTQGTSGFQTCPPLNGFDSGFMQGVSARQLFSGDESSYMGTGFVGDSNLTDVLRHDPHSFTLMPAHGGSAVHQLPIPSKRNISCSKRVQRRLDAANITASGLLSAALSRTYQCN